MTTETKILQSGFTMASDFLAWKYQDIDYALIYGKIFRFTQVGKDSVCTATVQTLADELLLSKTLVDAKLKKLEEDGYILDLDAKLKNLYHRRVLTDKLEREESAFWAFESEFSKTQRTRSFLTAFIAYARVNSIQPCFSIIDKPKVARGRNGGRKNNQNMNTGNQPLITGNQPLITEQSKFDLKESIFDNDNSTYNSIRKSSKVLESIPENKNSKSNLPNLPIEEIATAHSSIGEGFANAHPSDLVDLSTSLESIDKKENILDLMPSLENENLFSEKDSISISNSGETPAELSSTEDYPAILIEPDTEEDREFLQKFNLEKFPTPDSKFLHKKLKPFLGSFWIKPTGYTLENFLDLLYKAVFPGEHAVDGTLGLEVDTF